MVNWNGLEDVNEREDENDEVDDAAYEWVPGSRHGERSILVNKTYGTIWHQNGVDR